MRRPCGAGLRRRRAMSATLRTPTAMANTSEVSRLSDAAANKTPAITGLSRLSATMPASKKHAAQISVRSRPSVNRKPK